MNHMDPNHETVLDRRFPLSVWALSLAAFLLRILWLPSQPPSVDDFSVAITAINYVESGQLGPTMWNHPGLRNLLVYWSMQLFGSGVVGVKGWCVLFGTLSVPLLALVARRLTGSAAAALIAALLWTVEPLAIDFSRQGINDIYLAFFPLLAIWCALRYEEGRNPWWLVASGTAFGLGLASKWSVVFPLAVTGGLLCLHLFRKRSGGSLLVARLSFLACSLVILPLTVYLLTFYPWFGRGYSLFEWPILQKAMYHETKLHTGYHTTLQGDHRAWEWFVRPVTYQETFFVRTNDQEPTREPSVEENAVILLAVANPLVWLLILPATAWTAWRGIRTRNRMLCYMAALFVITYLPFALAPRPIWVNTAVAVLPFAFMILGHALWDNLGGSRARRWKLVIYLAAVLISTAPLYLLAIDKGLRIPFLGEQIIRTLQLGQHSGV